MTPSLTGIDHIHVSVTNWAEAEEWYGKILGMKRVEALMDWAVENGPLTIEDPAGKIHLALFERKDVPTISAVAFGASGAEFLEWKYHLESHGLKLRITDHELAYSLYFNDPFGNMHEITTYERDYVAERIKT